MIMEGVPKVEYIKKAAECLGRQRGSNIWVLNEEIQVNEGWTSLTFSLQLPC